MDLREILQTGVGGLSIGAVYALVALLWLIPDRRLERTMAHRADASD